MRVRLHLHTLLRRDLGFGGGGRRCRLSRRLSRRLHISPRFGLECIHLGLGFRYCRGAIRLGLRHRRLGRLPLRSRRRSRRLRPCRLRLRCLHLDLSRLHLRLQLLDLRHGTCLNCLRVLRLLGSLRLSGRHAGLSGRRLSRRRLGC